METYLCTLAFQNFVACFCYGWVVCLVCRFICGLKFANTIETPKHLDMRWGQGLTDMLVH